MAGVFLVIHCFAVSQYLEQVNETDQEYENTVAYNFDGDYLTSVNPMSDSNRAQHGWNIIQFKQYDEEFNVIRDMRFQDSLHAYWQGVDLLFNDGFYYFSGFRRGLFSQGNQQPYIVKFDSIGNQIWIKDYFSNVPNTSITHLKKYNDRLFIGGYHNYEPDSVIQHSFIGEIDTAGNILWTTKIEEYNSSVVNGLEILASGDLLLSTSYIDQVQNIKTMFYKFDNLGNIMWSRSFGINGVWLQSKAITCELPDESLLCYGSISDPNGAEFLRSWLFIMDTEGNLIKDTIYKFSQHNDFFSTWFNEPIIKNEEIILLGGYRQDGTSPKNSYVASIDFDLNLNWMHIYGNHTSRKNELTFLYNLENGFYLMSGHINDEALNDPVVDEWFMVVDSLGCSVADCILGVEELNQKSTYFEIYPNPTDKKAILKIPSFEESNYNVSFYNSIGRTVDITLVPSATGYEINTSKIASGIYQIVLCDKKGVVSNKKLVIQH